MSYYKSFKYIVTNHAYVRIRERIKKHKNSDDIKIKIWINKILEECCTPEFYDKHYLYIPVPDIYNMYIILKKDSFIVVSVREITATKKIKILESE